MPVNRFWASIGSAASFLIAISILNYFVDTVFELFPASMARSVGWIVALVVTIIGVLAFVKYRWGWSAEYIGLARNRPSAVWLLIGTVLGASAGLLATILTLWNGGGNLALGVGGLSWLPFLVLLPSAFVVELVYRGALISRFQSDLNHREVLIAATLAPFAWMLIQQFFLFGQPPTQIFNAWTAAMSIALALIYVRFDSVWLATGLRFGMLGAVSLLGTTTRQIESGGLMVWGSVAAVLLALEWKKMQGTPQRVQPSRGPRGLRTSGRTVRGPWGPH